MTDLVRPEPPSDIQIFVRDASSVQKVSDVLAQTTFVPSALRGKPLEITAAIMYGTEIGLDPMVSLQAINVIEGRPSLNALAMRGLAQSHGVKFRLIESTETRCQMAAIAPGDDQWTEILWTIDRAKKLGLTGKSNWTKQPQSMLIARATSELCRLVAAGIFVGHGYSTEELRDGTDDEAWNPPPTAAPQPEKPRKSVRRQPLKATVEPAYPEPEPEPQYNPTVQEIGYVTDDVSPRELEPAPPRNDPLENKTRVALLAAFGEKGIRDRAERLSYVSEVAGREVHSVNQLTDEEGRYVLSVLNGDEWPPVAQAPE